MKKILLAILFTGILSSCSSIMITPRPIPQIESVNKISKENIKRIAVLDIQSNSTVNNSSYCLGLKMIENVDNSGEIVRSYAEAELLKYFDVVERQVIDNIISEQDLQNSNRFDKSSAVEIGKLLGCDAVLVGAVSEANASLICNPSVGAIYTGSCSIEMRLIDVTTSQIIWVAELSRSTPNYFTSTLTLKRSDLNRIIKEQGGDMSRYVFGSTTNEIVKYVMKRATKELITDMIK